MAGKAIVVNFEFKHKSMGFSFRTVEGWRRWRRSSANFRTRVTFVIMVTVFGVALTFGLVLGQSTLKASREHIGGSLQRDAARIAGQLNRMMAARERDLTLLGVLDPANNLRDPAAQKAMLDQLRRQMPGYNWVAIIRDGKILAQSGERQGNDRSDMRANMRVDSPRMERGGAIMLSRPVAGSEGKPNSVIMAELSGNWVRDIGINALTPDDDGKTTREIYLIGADHVVVSGPGGSVGTRLSLPVIDRARAGGAFWSTERWPDGMFLTGVALAAGDGGKSGARSQMMNWTVLVRENVSMVSAAVGVLRLQSVTLASLLALVFLPIGWAIAGEVTAPLRKIADFADRLRQGDDVEFPKLHAIAEIETLIASLRALVASLTNKEIELAEMEDRATHDSLTGLYNRAGLHRWLQFATARGRREGSGILLLVGDLDGFKDVNDTLGHAVGDQLLQQVAARLGHDVRSNDAVARLGGDEFVVAVVAQKHEGNEALVIAQRLLAHAMKPYMVSGRQVEIGMTVGAALWPDEDQDVMQVIQMADRALFVGKRAGKRQIVFHHDVQREKEAAEA